MSYTRSFKIFFYKTNGGKWTNEPLDGRWWSGWTSATPEERPMRCRPPEPCLHAFRITSCHRFKINSFYLHYLTIENALLADRSLSKAQVIHLHFSWATNFPDSSIDTYLYVTHAQSHVELISTQIHFNHSSCWAWPGYTHPSTSRQ